MYVVGFEATIGGKTFRRLHSVEIEESINQLGKSALLKLPATARLERAGEFVSEVETAKTFSVGDQVVIRCGYDGDLREEFRGYVRRIRPTVPLELECEDDAYVLKRKNLQRSFQSTTLESVLNYILADTGVELAGEVPQINLATFYLRNVSAARALDEIRTKYGLRVYLRAPGQLFVGLTSATDGTIVRYVIGRNVIDHDLEWSDASDVQLKAKAILIDRENNHTEVTVGDPEGEQRTLYFYDLADGQTLAERASEELLRYRYTGYRGSLSGFLLPVCRIGNTVRLSDDTFDNREGDYLVERVKTTLSDSGGRRKVEIGLKLD